MNRRDFLKVSGLASAGLPLTGSRILEAADTANYTLRIAGISGDRSRKNRQDDGL